MQTILKIKQTLLTLVLLLIASAVVASPLLYSKIAYGAGTFPPGVYYNLRAIPSYAKATPYYKGICNKV